MKIICPHCKHESERKTGYVNRAKKLGVPIYCTKKCSALARMIFRTDEEKKRIKSEYDKKHRKEYSAELKKKKAIAFQIDYKNNPEKYRLERIKRKEEHKKYIQTPKYKKWKKEYDHEYKMKLKYGEFWECGSVLVKLNEELDSREIKINLGIINKSQKRKRKWHKQKQNFLQRI